MALQSDVRGAGALMACLSLWTGLPSADGPLDRFRALERRQDEALQRGRYREARAILEEAREAASPPVGRTPMARRQAAVPPPADAATILADMAARDALERQDWRGAMALAPDARSAASALLFAKGVAAARAVRFLHDEAAMSVARDAAAALDVIAGREGRRGRAEIERLGVLAAIAAAQEERDEMQVLLTHAIALDARADDGGALPRLPIPNRELAGDLWLQVDRYADAVREYGASLERYPRRARSLLGLARASAKAGDAATARRAYDELLDVWREADADRPEMAEAKRSLGRP